MEVDTYDEVISPKERETDSKSRDKTGGRYRDKSLN
jgi:hypothetical protein